MSRYIDADVRVGVPIKEAVIIEKTELTDECIDKIAEAVVQKLADRKTEPQILDDIGRQIQDAYDKGLLSDADATQAWYEAVNKTEPQTITIEGKMSLNEWRKICPENPQFKDEPQTDCSWK